MEAWSGSRSAKVSKTAEQQTHSNNKLLLFEGLTSGLLTSSIVGVFDIQLKCIKRKFILVMETLKTN